MLFLRFLRRPLLFVAQPGITIVHCTVGHELGGGTNQCHDGWVSALRAGTALGILIIATAQANAGAFAIREQSTYGQGTSFAGVAAGGSVSSMFWNPATMTQFQGIRMENGLTTIFPHVGADAASPAARLPDRRSFIPGVSNSGDQCTGGERLHVLSISPNLWMGLGINAPFGLSVSFQEPWAGRNYGGDTTLKTYNANPNIAYRINDWISIGVGVQLQYATVRQTSGVTPIPADRRHVWTAKAGASARPRALRSRRGETRRSDSGGARRSIRTSTARSLVPRRDSQHVRFGGVHGQPSRHRQPWYSPPLRPSLDGHGYG